MSAATIDRRLAVDRARLTRAGPLPHQARVAAEVPDPDPHLGRLGRQPARVRRDRPGRPRGRLAGRRVLLHPDRDRHRHRLDGEPDGPQQGPEVGVRRAGDRAGPVPVPDPRASTRTTAASSSTTTCSPGASAARSPSPGPGPGTRTTAPTSSRRTGPGSASWSATTATTPKPNWTC